jgi:hypothetical protein
MPLAPKQELGQVDGDSEDGDGGEAASPGGKRHQLAAELAPAETEELLQMIFLALQARAAAADCRSRGLGRAAVGPLP